MPKRAWIFIVVVLVLGAVYYLASRPPRLPTPPPGATDVQHPIPELGCDEDSLVMSVKVAAANAALKGHTEMSWERIMACLATMPVVDSLGERGHALLPLESHNIVYDSASIFPRPNIWWDEAPKPTGRVVARIESTGIYRRLGLNGTSQNYLIVAGLKASTPEMIVVNGDGATTIGKREGGPMYIPHGPIVGFVPRPGIEPGNPKTEPGAPAPGTGGLSPSALKCFLTGWKACFIDSAEQQIEPLPGGSAGFGIGMPVVRRNPGMTVPWAACSKYGCCCGGTQCHSGTS